MGERFIAKRKKKSFSSTIYDIFVLLSALVTVVIGLGIGGYVVIQGATGRFSILSGNGLLTYMLTVAPGLLIAVIGAVFAWIILRKLEANVHRESEENHSINEPSPPKVSKVVRQSDYIMPLMYVLGIVLAVMYVLHTR